MNRYSTYMPTRRLIAALSLCLPLAAMSLAPTSAFAQDDAPAVEATESANAELTAQIDAVTSALEAHDFEAFFTSVSAVDVSLIETEADKEAVRGIMTALQGLPPEAMQELNATVETNPDSQAAAQHFQRVMMAAAPPPPPHPMLGQSPEFSLTTLDGDSLDQTNVGGGKYVVLDFWATWCGPCIASFPHMRELYSEYSGQVEIIGLSLDDEKEDVTTWLAQEGNDLPWTIAHNGGAFADPMAQTFAIRGIPTCFLLSPEGEILWGGHPMAGLDQALAEHVGAHEDATEDASADAPAQ